MLKEFENWDAVYEEDSFSADKRGSFGRTQDWPFTVGDIRDLIYSEMDEFIRVAGCPGVGGKLNSARERAVQWFQDNKIFATHIRVTKIGDPQKKISKQGFLWLYLEITRNGYRKFFLVDNDGGFTPVWTCPAEATVYYAEALWWPVFQNWREVQRKAIHDTELNRQDMEPAINLLDNFDKGEEIQ